MPHKNQQQQQQQQQQKRQQQRRPQHLKSQAMPRFSPSLSAVFLLVANLPCVYSNTISYGPCTNTTVNTTCFDDENRVCVQKNETVDDVSTITDECGACMAGHIPSFLDNTTCVAISSITFQDYLDVFAPVFYEEIAEALRLELLVAAMEFVSEHNAKIPPPEFTLEVNHISAFNESEKQRLNGYRHSKDIELPLLPKLAEGGRRELSSLPSSVNWVDQGAVTSVKNQAQCGCCWSVSTVGAIEGLAAINSNFTYLESLSFQEFISCDKGNDGCYGGSVTGAMQWAGDNSYNGIVSDTDYPFVDQSGTTTEDCLLDNDTMSVAVRVVGSGTVVSYTTTNNFTARIEDLKTILADQPISIVIDANCNLFNYYSSGILTSDAGCSCESQACIDHAVLLVGYNDSADTPYWLVKNSWSTAWGESGYFRVAQTASSSMKWGLFGILAQGTVPTNAFNVSAEQTSDAFTSRSFGLSGSLGVGAVLLMSALL